jgi:hypothetical protein
MKKKPVTMGFLILSAVDGRLESGRRSAVVI